MADMSELMKLMAKKKGKALSPEYKDAKLGVLKDLHSEMSGMIGDDVKGLKKVTVAAPDSQGLKSGLDKAKELLGSKLADDSEPDAEDAAEGEEGESEGEHCPACEVDNCSEHEAKAGEGMETPEEEKLEDEALSPDEIDAKIKELMALKLKKQS